MFIKRNPVKIETIERQKSRKKNTHGKIYKWIELFIRYEIL